MTDPDRYRQPHAPDGRQQGPPPPTTSSEVEHSALAQTIASQLTASSYECMICTETIRHAVATWPCAHCYRIFHLYCIKQWSKRDDSGTGRSFRCPACQHPVEGYPNKYRCFCGKVVDPPASGFNTPHSCGEPCGKIRGPSCPHRCTLLCHPGPCPDCGVKVPPKPCPCGSTTYTYQCGKQDPRKTCTSICGKTLNCGQHTCQERCHHGPCKPCAATDEVSCHCGRDDKVLPCGTPSFSCGDPCGRLLRCGEHHCNVACHEGNCPPCDTDVALITMCPCGKEALTAPRTKCTDPIASCGQICGKVLLCGNHQCMEMCHAGPCPPCESKVALSCPCGSMKGKVFCKDQEAFRCHKKCKTKLSCGKHECENICCAHKNEAGHSAHACTRNCGKKLPCGHNCPEPCHRGACPMCLNVITSTLTCFCGAEELIPPLPCGTQPPECNLPCRKRLECGHEPIPHKCHFGACPPCMHPVEKQCACGRKKLRSIACSSIAPSCHEVCGKPLRCGHGCARKCHAGPCDATPGGTAPRKCTQPCKRPLPCGHQCSAPCHPERPCPGCAASVEIVCDCGARRSKLSCKAHAQKKLYLPEGMPVALDCNDDCAHKNRLDAIASLRPTKSAAPTKVIYSIKAWHFAKENVDMVASVEKRLIDFVESGAHTVNLPHMSPEKRMITHELSNIFHIHCESVDSGPQRSCLLTRHSKTTIPSPLLSDAVANDANDPGAFASHILASEQKCAERVLLITGPHVSEMLITGLLRQFCGTFVIPPPLDSDTTIEGITFKVIFTSKQEMMNAYSFLRKSDVQVRFRMFGHSQNFEPGSSAAAAPSRGGFFDRASPQRPAPSQQQQQQQTSMKWGPGKGRHTDPAPSSMGNNGQSGPAASSWAALLRPGDAGKPTKKKDEPIPTHNKFEQLRK